MNTGKKFYSPPTLVLLATLFMLGMLIRAEGLNFRITYDATLFLDYYEFLEATPSYALSQDFTKLSTAHLYLLTLATKLPFYPIWNLKLLNIVFDYLIVLWAFLILRRSVPEEQALYGAVTLMLSPTMIMNTSYWGQIDSVYVSFLMLSIYFLWRDECTGLKRGFDLSVACFGIALSFKLQSIFLLPALCYFAARNPKRLLALAAIPPVVYYLIMAPRFAVGYPFEFILGSYQEQVASSGFHVLSGATFYRLLGLQKLAYEYKIFLGAGMGGLLCAGFAFKGWLSRLRPHNPADVALVCLISAVFVPYFIPSIYERYFYLADMLSVLWVFLARDSRYVPIAIIINICSVIAYLPHQVGVQVNMRLISLGMLVALCALLLIAKNHLVENAKAAPRKATKKPRIRK